MRLLLVLLVATAIAPSARAVDRISVYVGPPISKEGFVETTPDIADSIKDVQGVIQWDNKWTLTDTPDSADVVLRIVFRGHDVRPGAGGAMAFPIGNTIFAMSVDKSFNLVIVDIAVGDYHKTIQSPEPGERNTTWHGAAERIVKKLSVWIDANQETIRQKRKQ